MWMCELENDGCGRQGREGMIDLYKPWTSL